MPGERPGTTAHVLVDFLSRALAAHPHDDLIESILSPPYDCGR